MYAIIVFQHINKLEEFFKSMGSKLTQVEFDLDNPLVFSCNCSEDNMLKLSAAYEFNFWKQRPTGSKPKYARV